MFNSKQFSFISPILPYNKYTTSIFKFSTLNKQDYISLKTQASLLSPNFHNIDKIYDWLDIHYMLYRNFNLNSSLSMYLFDNI